MRTHASQRPQKSGSSPGGGARQFMALASICASVYLPAPSGPERITACGKRPRLSIVRRSRTMVSLPIKSLKLMRVCLGFQMSLAKLQALLHRLQNILMHGRDGAPRINPHHPFGLPLRDANVSLAHALEKIAALALKAALVQFACPVPSRVRTVSPARPGDAGSNIRIHPDGELRLKPATQNSMQRQHRLASQLPAPALVCFAGVGEAIAQYNVFSP